MKLIRPKTIETENSIVIVKITYNVNIFIKFLFLIENIALFANL